MFISQKEIDCPGLRYPKIFSYKDVNYLIGSKKYDQKEDIVKYAVFLMKMDEEFNVIDEGRFIEFEDYPYLNDILLTSWTRDINVKDDILYLNVEVKQNVNNETFYDNNILLSTTNLFDFTFIKRYEVTDFLFKDLTHKNNHYLFSSKIMKDEEDPDYFRGIYLFNIFINGQEHRPKFDAIVDYKKDKGHLIHNVVINPSKNKHVMYFSIRHKVEKSVHKSGFIYKIYKAETNDLINYFNTQEVEFKNAHTKSNWYSYSHYFEYKGQQYIITNQDDYGKSSNPVLFIEKDNL